MRKFNFKNAITSGKSMANGQATVCAKSNLHCVEPDALRLYLCGWSRPSIGSSARILSGTAGTCDQKFSATFCFGADRGQTSFGTDGQIGDFAGSESNRFVQPASVDQFGPLSIGHTPIRQMPTGVTCQGSAGMARSTVGLGLS